MTDLSTENIVRKADDQPTIKSHDWKVGLTGVFIKKSNENRRWSCLRGHVITIEGLIGAGKSTLGRSLVQYLTNIGLDAKFYSEFVHLPLLEQYISNMSKYGYSFQIIMVRERLRIYRVAMEAADRGEISIIDRCMLGDVAFARMLHQQKILSDDEWSTYLSLIKKDEIIEPSLTVYLDCSAKEAFNRMLSRSNQAEVTGYSLEYFEHLEKSYQEIISAINPPLIKVDWEIPRQTKMNLDIATMNGSLHNNKSSLHDDDCRSVLSEIRDYLINPV